MLKDHKGGFGLVSILLHWVSALLIIFLFGLGLYMVDLGYYEPFYHTGPALHVSLGLLLLLMTLFRILWRLVNGRNPRPLPEHSWLIRMLSGTVQYSLYLLVLIVIASGYLITTAKGDPASMFDWIDFPSLIQLSSDGVDLAGALHYWLAWAIIGFSGLHAAAALMHHFLFRDRTMVRMLDPRKPD